MIKRTFTIVELLVAMALTFVVIMALSTIYVRISNFALEQAGSASSYSAGSTVLDKIEDDFRRLYLPTIAVGAGSPARLLSTVGSAYVNSSNIAVPGLQVVPVIAPPTSTPQGWPYLAFTVTPSGNYSDIGNSVDDYGSVAYFCGPPIIGASTIGLSTLEGKIDINFLTLYRSVSNRRLTASSSLFKTLYPTPTVSGNLLGGSSNVISNKLIYMATVFHQGLGANRATRTRVDTTLNTLNNTSDYTPDDVDIILTVVPDSGYLEFNIPSTDPTVTFQGYIENGDNSTSNERVALIAITKANSFAWDSEGFFANLRTGIVYYYVLFPSELHIFNVQTSGTSSIQSTDTLITGTTTKRRIQLK